jgi:hypothetical protein
MYIEANNMFEAWVKLNEAFMVLDPNTGMYMSSRDYTRVCSVVRMHVAGGFGFNADQYSMLPEFFAKYQNRINLLAKRYIDPPLWEEGIARIKDREKRMQLKNPLSFVIQFHRTATRERKVPAGGGCLSQVIFIWNEGRWALHVTLRASEITAALMGDIVFVEWIVRQVAERVKLKNLDLDNMEIVWDIALASQMKSIIPLFLFYTGGDERVLGALFRDPKEQNIWFADVINHFWHTFVHLERVTWHRRQRWTKQFLERTEVNWKKAYKKWGKEFNEELQ